MRYYITAVFALLFIFVTPAVYSDITKSTTESVDIVIIAPHPDDAELGAGRLMMNAIAEGKTVAIITLTNGDAKELGAYETSQQYGFQRINEQFSAAAVLGIPHQVYTLNYPDSHLRDLQNTILTRSKYTGQIRTNALSYSPNSFYTRSRLEYLLHKLLVQLNPQEIYITSPEDKHADHKEAFALLRDLYYTYPELSAEVYTYQIHGRLFPQKSTPDPEKQALLQTYRSQFHTKEYRDFMERYAQYPEVFTSIDTNTFQVKPITISTDLLMENSESETFFEMDQK